MKKNGAGLMALLLLILLLTGGPDLRACAADAAEKQEASVVLVAGNPDLYPLEYYDRRRQDFAGAIPDLLREVGEQVGLEIRYLEPSLIDRRESFLASDRVALVSGLLDSEGGDWNLAGRSTELAILPASDGRDGVRIGWTEDADMIQITRINNVLSRLSRGEVSRLVLAHVRGPHLSKMEIAVTAALLLALALICAMIYLIINHRNTTIRLRRLITDPATGLGTVHYFQNTFRRCITDKNRTIYCVVYFGVDMDRFYMYYGAEKSNDLMNRLAEQLREHCAREDVLTRTGENCFAMLRRISGPEEHRRWMEHFFHHIWEMYPEPNLPHSLRFHAGTYYLTQEDTDPAAALFNARQGYLRAVERGNDFDEICEEEMAANARRDQNIRDLQDALEEGQIKLFLQPLVSAHSGRTIGAEALARWEHPTRGLLGPDQFIDMMVREGMISRLDYYMFEQTCALLESLEKQGMDGLFVTCNFSPVTLDAPELLHTVKKIMGRYRFTHRHLVVEVTEEVVSRNPDTYQRNLEALKDMGLSTALDDFGSGYTSFRELSTHSFNILKLDQTLLWNIAQPYGEEILSGLIEFTRSLHLQVLCEGVEEVEQAELLRKMGCDILQGYYFSRPRPAAEVCREFFINREVPLLHAAAAG